MSLHVEGPWKARSSTGSKRPERAQAHLSAGSITQLRVRPSRRLLAAVACAVFIGGCGSGTPPGTATPTTTPLPTATAAPLPSATATVAPTEITPPALTPTLAPFPTSTPAGCSLVHPCAPGQFCELPNGVCATDLDSGLCAEVPNACFGVDEPVCGCDGLTYANECLRRAGRVSQAHSGACPSSECFDPCDCYATRRFVAPCTLECATCGNFWTCEQSHCLEHCGMVPSDVCNVLCSRNEQCTSDTYCEKPVGECDGLGACQQRPRVCPAIEDPVCGCDGRTYSNGCYAGWDGVAIAHRGPCQREPIQRPAR